MPPVSALAASKILREGSLFQWYVIALFALVVYVYAVEIERKTGISFSADWPFGAWTGSMRFGTVWFFISPATLRFEGPRGKPPI